MKKIILLSLCVLGCATAPPKFSPQEEAVNVIRGSFSLVGCSQVGVIDEMIPSALFYAVPRDVAADAVRAPAAAMGANTVIIVNNPSFGERVIGKALLCK